MPNSLARVRHFIAILSALCTKRGKRAENHCATACRQLRFLSTLLSARSCICLHEKVVWQCLYARHVQQPLHAMGLHALWQCEAQQTITGGSTDSLSDCLCYLPLLFFLPPVFLLSPLVVVLLIADNRVDTVQTECRWNAPLYTLRNAMIINCLCTKVQSVDKNRYFNLLLVIYELAHTIRSKAVR